MSASSSVSSSSASSAVYSSSSSTPSPMHSTSTRLSIGNLPGVPQEIIRGFLGFFEHTGSAKGSKQNRLMESRIQNDNRFKEMLSNAMKSLMKSILVAANKELLNFSELESILNSIKFLLAYPTPDHDQPTEELIGFFIEQIFPKITNLSQRKSLIYLLVNISTPERGIAIFKILEKGLPPWATIEDKVDFLVEWAENLKKDDEKSEKEIIDRRTAILPDSPKISEEELIKKMLNLRKTGITDTEYVLNFALETYLKGLGHFQPNITYFRNLLQKKCYIDARKICKLIDAHIASSHRLFMKIDVMTYGFSGSKNDDDEKSTQQRFLRLQDASQLLCELINSLITDFQAQLTENYFLCALLALLNRLNDIVPHQASRFIPRILQIPVIKAFLNEENPGDTVINLEDLKNLRETFLNIIEDLMESNAYTQAKGILNLLSPYFTLQNANLGPRAHLCVCALHQKNGNLEESLNHFNELQKDPKLASQCILLGLDLVEALFAKGKVEEATHLWENLYILSKEAEPTRGQFVAGVKNQLTLWITATVLNKLMHLDPVNGWEFVRRGFSVDPLAREYRSELVYLFLSYSDKLRDKADTDKAKEAFSRACILEQSIGRLSDSFLAKASQVEKTWLQPYIEYCNLSRSKLVCGLATYNPSLAREIYTTPTTGDRYNSSVGTSAPSLDDKYPLFLIAASFENQNNEPAAQEIWNQIKLLEYTWNDFQTLLSNLDSANIDTQLLNRIFHKLEEMLEEKNLKTPAPLAEDFYDSLKCYKQLMILEAKTQDALHLVNMLKNLMLCKQNHHVEGEWEKRLDRNFNGITLLNQMITIQTTTRKNQAVERASREASGMSGIPDSPSDFSRGSNSPLATFSPAQTAVIRASFGDSLDRLPILETTSLRPHCDLDVLFDCALDLVEKMQNPSDSVQSLIEFLDHYYALTGQNRETWTMNKSAFEAAVKTLLIKGVQGVIGRDLPPTGAASAVSPISQKEPSSQKICTPALLIHLVRLGAQDDTIERVKEKFKTGLDNANQKQLNALLESMKKIPLGESKEIQDKIIKQMTSLLDTVSERIFQFAQENLSKNDLLANRDLLNKLVFMAMDFSPLHAVGYKIKYINIELNKKINKATGQIAQKVLQ